MNNLKNNRFIHWLITYGFYIYLFICTLFMWVCSICYLCKYEEYKDLINSSEIVNSQSLQTADSVSSTFSSSNFAFLLSVYDSSSNSDTLYLPLNFVLSDGGFDIMAQSSSYGDFLFEMPFNLIDFDRDNHWFDLSNSYGDSHIFFGYVCQSQFNFRVAKITVGTNPNYANYHVTFIDFVDINGYQWSFVFRISNSFTGYFDYMSDRNYFLVNGSSDNAYYDSGYDAGYDSGVIDGSRLGYADGYSAGSDVGYNNGYRDGLDSANVYTFGNLLTAVIDAPVNVFMSLLDFNIMGYNLLTIVTGLLTFAFIVLVVKLLLGGR